MKETIGYLISYEAGSGSCLMSIQQNEIVVFNFQYSVKQAFKVLGVSHNIQQNRNLTRTALTIFLTTRKLNVNVDTFAVVKEGMDGVLRFN